MTAVRASDHALVAVLLQWRASPNVGDAMGETPLMDAVGNGNHLLCQMLLAFRADVNRKNMLELKASDMIEDDSIWELFHDAPHEERIVETVLANHGMEDATVTTGTSEELLDEASVGIGSAGSTSSETLQESSAVGSNEISAEPALLRWSIPFVDMRGLRKDHHLESEPFTVPGVPCLFRIWFQPKGGSNAPGARKGYSSITIWTRDLRKDDGYRGANCKAVQLEYFPNEGSEPDFIDEVNLSEEEYSCVANFTRTPQGDVRIKVVHADCTSGIPRLKIFYNES
jgi:hypothetical protein